MAVALRKNLDGAYTVGDNDQRPWGTWEVVSVGDRFVTKCITVFPKQRLSLQFHNHRAEHWVIVEGEGLVEIDGSVRDVQHNSHVHIPKGKTHRIENTGETPLIFIETQLGDVLSENDIVRVSDDYGRS